jgi:peptidoglycan/xylan/chitin deacetylase (PgdA/CDA1 family)
MHPGNILSKKIITCLGVLVAVLSACGQSPVEVTPTLAASSTPVPSLTSTPSATYTPTTTQVRTPPALPGVFQTGLLNPNDPPHGYIQDSCQYLQDKWSSQNSPPGTVAIVIMFHSIIEDYVTPTDNQITKKTFRDLIGSLMSNGFEAVTTVQLADFMEHNASIPPRSVLLVVDDRHHIPYFDEYWREYWEADGWPVVNAYISAERDGYDASVFQEQEALNAEGWVDYQAHGVVHNTPMWPGVSDAYITGELQGSIDAFQRHFNKAPIAIIWPGGGFSNRSVEIARQLGYRLGFTTNPRGPLMFNWVPLADKEDSQRPAWAAEGTMNDPLLVLPRYWDVDAARRLDDVVKMSTDAAAYAEQNKATELEYYDIVCSAQYGPIP